MVIMDMEDATVETISCVSVGRVFLLRNVNVSSRCIRDVVQIVEQSAMARDNLDKIIKEQTPRLRSFVRSKVGNNDDADDIVQDTLYQFMHSIRIMDNPVRHLTSWLYTVAHNLVINHGKKRREASMPYSSLSEDTDFMGDLSEIMVASDDDGPDILVLRAMVWDELHKALSELPKEQREAVEMTEIQGLSVKEAAEKMGVPVNTFLSRKHYATVHIRARLRDLYEELVGR